MDIEIVIKLNVRNLDEAVQLRSSILLMLSKIDIDDAKLAGALTGVYSLLHRLECEIGKMKTET